MINEDKKNVHDDTEPYLRVKVVLYMHMFTISNN
jgi:hypothetical protein